MKILVACEESQAVTEELRRLGHEAYSCDIQECSGGHPEWHIVDDVLPLLNGNCEFRVQDASEDAKTILGKWDMIIAFPPCTHLAVSGARHFEAKRADGRQREGIEFFCQFLKADCEKIAIENPIGIISGDYIPKWFPDLAEKYGLPRKQSQIIQPYEYGHPSKKSTCLWLKGLPLLQPTEIVEPDLVRYQCKNGKIATFSRHMVQGFENGERAKSRSKTFPGIAKAMAEQWTMDENEHSLSSERYTEVCNGEEMMHCTEWIGVQEMNEREVIKEFKKRLAIPDCRKQIPEYYEAMEIAVQSMEKQIPQEVVNQGGIPLSGYCPRCNAKISKPSSPVGCKWCLQRVKWRNEE